MDVILVLGAVNPANFEKQKQAIMEMARQHQNTNLDYIYEVIQHGNAAIVKKSLKDRMNNQDLQSFVGSLVIEEPGKAILDAIRLAKLSFEQHSRPKAKRMLVVFSDSGIYNDPLNSFQELGEKLREDHVKIIGVTVQDVRGNLDEKVEGLTGNKPLKIDTVNNDNTPEKTGKKIAQETVAG